MNRTAGTIFAGLAFNPDISRRWIPESFKIQGVIPGGRQFKWKTSDLMKKDDYSNPGLQRLFQKGTNNFVLLHKYGQAVAFQSDQNGNINILDRQTDIDFTSTGLFLLDDGWTCVGPGLTYSRLLE